MPVMDEPKIIPALTTAHLSLGKEKRDQIIEISRLRRQNELMSAENDKLSAANSALQEQLKQAAEQEATLRAQVQQAIEERDKLVREAESLPTTWGKTLLYYGTKTSHRIIDSNAKMKAIIELLIVFTFGHLQNARRILNRDGPILLELLATALSRAASDAVRKIQISWEILKFLIFHEAWKMLNFVLFMMLKPSIAWTFGVITAAITRVFGIIAAIIALIFSVISATVRIIHGTWRMLCESIPYLIVVVAIHSASTTAGPTWYIFQYRPVAHLAYQLVALLFLKRKNFTPLMPRDLWHAILLAVVVYVTINGDLRGALNASPGLSDVSYASTII
jgi:hypothetical protein